MQARPDPCPVHLDDLLEVTAQSLATLGLGLSGRTGSLALSVGHLLGNLVPGRGADGLLLGNQRLDGPKAELCVILCGPLQGREQGSSTRVSLGRFGDASRRAPFLGARSPFDDRRGVSVPRRSRDVGRPRFLGVDPVSASGGALDWNAVHSSWGTVPTPAAVSTT